MTIWSRFNINLHKLATDKIRIGDLEEGNVFTIEPTILMSPQPSMLVEENVVVTATAAEWLSERQTSLWLAGRKTWEEA